MKTARGHSSTTALLAAAFLLGVLAPWRLAAQDTLPPPERYRPTTAFPVSVGLMLASGRYGNRAQTSSGGGGPTTYNLSGGLAAGVKLQAPLTRRLGVVVAGSITRRNRGGESGGNPVSLPDEKVIFNRFEAGLGFRFRPYAPVFFGAVFVYDLISPGPVEGQAENASEAGGGIGVGYDFARSARHNFFGRVEMWNYWVKPSATGLVSGYEAKSLTHDLAIALSVNYRIGLTSRGPDGSGR